MFYGLKKPKSNTGRFMRIADITAQDTGGQSFKLSRAINEYTEHTSRSFCGSSDYLDFPTDITHDTDQSIIDEYLANTDIIHVHNMYRYANGWAPINPGAKWLIHQHGRPGQVDWGMVKLDDKKRGAKRFVSTINLLRYVDNNPERWIPAPIRLSDFDELKKLYKKTDKIRIAHSPTNREYKNTNLLIEIVSRIPNAELVLIEGKPNAECLRIKATCDITFDQMHLQYGNSGLEAMALGQATIVGPTDDARENIEKIIGYEPYAYATPDTLEDILRRLVEDEDYRNEMGKIGRKYVEDWHDDKKVAEKMIGIYEKL